MKKKEQKKQITLPKFNFSFSKSKKKVYVNASVILAVGIVITGLMLSISSGFVDLAHFSGLSKSKFHIGTLQLAAAALYTLISLGMISAKYWCAMMIGMIKELRTRLETRESTRTWAGGLRKAELPWQIAHKFLVVISLWTALSLSVNSIGTGIRVMEQNIRNMGNDANQLIALYKSVNDGVQDKRKAVKDNIDGQKTAQDTSSAEVKRFAERLKKYQDEYFNVGDDESLTSEEKEEKQKAIIDKIVKEIPGTSARNAIYFTEADLRKSIQKVATSNEVLDTTSLYEEGITYDQNQIEEVLRAIADKEYRTPDGELIEFILDDGSLINVQLAISRLQNAISKWQVDTGDVGESSKIYTLVATYMHADSRAGGMGAAEWMMMLFIAFIGISQEFLIYLFTPKARIDRGVLSLVSSYLKWKDEEEKERFLIDVYISYAGDGVLSKERFEQKCEKAVYYMELKAEDVISKYSKKNKVKGFKSAPRGTVEKTLPAVISRDESKPETETKEYGEKVTNLIKEIEEETKGL